LNRGLSPHLHPGILALTLVLALLAACSTPPRPRGDLPPELYETIEVAEAGDAEAQTVVGTMYETGVFGDPDYRAAALWYDRAVRQGDPLAAYYLGGLFEDGRGVDRDYVSAANLYRMAAQWGHVSAAFKLGYLYEKGLGVEQNFAEARRWYDLLSETGNTAMVPSYIAAGDGSGTAVQASTEQSQAFFATYHVHLGSEPSVEEAMATWRVLLARHPDLLGGLTPALATLELARGPIYYQLLAGPLADGAAADRICSVLQGVGQYCNPIAPRG